MKHKKMITAMAVIYLILGASYALAEYNLTISPTSDGVTPIAQTNRGEEIIVNIILDNPVDVAGCAFTLEFDPLVFTPPETDAEGLPVNENEIMSVFPFSFQTDEIDLTQTHRENSSEAGKIYFSGAAINTTDGGGLYSTVGDVALFTFKMTVKKDAPIADTTLTLKQTELWNLDAGYGTDVGGDGEFDEGVDTMGKVSVLVGAVNQDDPNFNDLTLAFPVLLGDPAGSLDTLILPVADCLDGDSDDLCDYVETGTGTYVSADDTGTSRTDADSDDDGLTDGEEVNTTGTDPNKSDTDGDGFNDKEEIDLNTDPNDENDYPLFIYFEGAQTLTVDSSGDYILKADVPPLENLKDYQITIDYDETVLDYVAYDSLLFAAGGNVNVDEGNGVIIISGLDATGVDGPATVSLVELTFTGLAEDDTVLTITVQKFGENDGNQFTMIPENFNLSVMDCLCGDANGSGTVNIWDALLIAEYDAGLKTADDLLGFACSDVNNSGAVNIWDALKVAEFDAGLVSELNCGGSE